MQPPRSRTPQIDLSSTESLCAIILYATAIAASAYILRLAALLVNGAEHLVVPGAILRITTPLVWPFQRLPVFNAELVQSVQLIDLMIIPALIVTGLLVAGVLTGWRSDARVRRYPALRE
jgi:hypothetical protein